LRADSSALAAVPVGFRKPRIAAENRSDGFVFGAHAPWRRVFPPLACRHLTPDDTRRRIHQMALPCAEEREGRPHSVRTVCCRRQSKSSEVQNIIAAAAPPRRQDHVRVGPIISCLSLVDARHPLARTRGVVVRDNSTETPAPEGESRKSNQ
jgi:hypothetical protein